VKPTEVWPEDHEKSTENRCLGLCHRGASGNSFRRFASCSAGCAAPGRTAPVIITERGPTKCRSAECKPAASWATAERCTSQNNGKFQPGDLAGHGQRWGRQPRGRPAKR